jgi:TM2 domain-containing membrane protein YozV
MSGATFGRKQAEAGGDQALAARRAAFLAEERARRNQPAAHHDPIGAPRAPVFVREKSTGTAYLLWFFLCGFSAHRFYLGYSTSAVIQLALTPIGYAMLIAGSLVGLPVLFCGGLWMLADVFIIPSMVREANRNIRDRAVGTVFA